jgi:hypothetical protein
MEQHHCHAGGGGGNGGKEQDPGQHPGRSGASAAAGRPGDATAATVSAPAGRRRCVPTWRSAQRPGPGAEQPDAAQQGVAPQKGAAPEARWTPDGVEVARAVVQAEEEEEGGDMPRMCGAACMPKSA